MSGEPAETVPVMPRAPALLRWPSYALGLLHRDARARIDAALGSQELSTKAYFVLTSLEQLGQPSQQQVADQIHLDRSDLVKLIDQLEAGGLVTRHRDPSDRRRQLLQLTNAGREAKRLGDELSLAATEEAFTALTEEERRTLHRLTLRALGEPEEIAG